MSRRTRSPWLRLLLGIANTAVAEEPVDTSIATDSALTQSKVEGDASPAAEASTSSSAADRFRLSLLLGCGIPRGDAIRNQPLSDGVSKMVPIELDLGFMVTKEVMVGLFGQYAFASLTHCGSGLDCAASDLRLGAKGYYHLNIAETILPWVGLGIGYEKLSTSSQRGDMAASAEYMGLEYFNLQGGADYLLSPRIGLGPWIGFSLGTYDKMTTTYHGMTAVGFPDGEKSIDIPTEQTALHEWFAFGVRGTIRP